ncbi:MAG: argininosuccinate lyase [Coriobacteriales bacterium]|jgi:argininosuccinate lyase|nr:argininosuccinate lyase [Coriobacteriales bacterium]
MALKALWGGRFEQFMNDEMQAFGASLPVDRRLWREDIAGSKAHARMLANQGIITRSDNEAIQEGLDAIAHDIEEGRLDFELSSEDIHMALEQELTRRIGEPGKKLHTGRSRNDQVVTDFRLYCVSAADELGEELEGLQRSIVAVAEAHLDTILPGYTHLQKAQPVLFAQHLLVWQAMLARDRERFAAARAAADASPLGAAALAGTPHAIDREDTASALGFSRVIPNSMDAVSDRDFACDFIYAAAMGMLHLSRICEELILWSTEEFGFITLSDEYTTGSSIMPQKKNADLAELTRGKTGRVYGDLLSILTTLKSLPLAYNKDLQEDKEGLFDAHDTLAACLAAVRGMIDTMSINTERMFEAAQGGYMAATDLADWLAAHDVAFRDAHEIVGRVVLYAEQHQKRLDELTLDELRQFSEAFVPEALEVLDIRNVVAARTSLGGTARKEVEAQLRAVKTRSF